MTSLIERIKKRSIQSYYRKIVTNELPKNSSLETCLLCGSSDFNTVWDHDRFSLPIRTVKCNSCDFVYVNPRPTKKYLDKFYSSKRYRGLYLGELKAKDLSFDSAQLKLEKNLTFFKDPKVQKILNLDFKHLNVLDYGSAVGQFLVGFKEAFPGSHIYGIEPGGHIHQVSKNMLDGIYDNADELPKNLKFDLITSWHVVEHIWNPIKVLKQLKEHLNPGGKLVIEVPDTDKYIGIRNIHIGHIYHFDKKTIQKLLELSGFEVLTITHNNVQDIPFGMKIIAQ